MIEDLHLIEDLNLNTESYTFGHTNNYTYTPNDEIIDITGILDESNRRMKRLEREIKLNDLLGDEKGQ